MTRLRTSSSPAVFAAASRNGRLLASPDFVADQKRRSEEIVALQLAHDHAGGLRALQRHQRTTGLWENGARKRFSAKTIESKLNGKVRNFGHL